LILGLLIDRIRLDEKLIMKAADRMDIKVELIDISKIFLDITKFDNRFSHIDIFLQRSISTLRGLYVTKILEAYGYEVINSFHTSLNCIDKVNSTILFAKNKVPTPHTIIAFSEEGGLRAIEQLGYPIILKPIMGSWARLVAKINDRDAAKSIFEDRKELGVWYSILYLQEFVNKPGRDIRSMVIGDNVVAAIYRINNDDWRTNTARGGQSINCEITEDLEDISLKAAKAVGGGILGVDIMEKENQLVAHEVNHSPEFKNIQRVSGIDIGAEIVKYLVERVKR